MKIEILHENMVILVLKNGARIIINDMSDPDWTELLISKEGDESSHVCYQTPRDERGELDAKRIEIYEKHEVEPKK